MEGSVAFVGDSLTAGGRWDEWLPELRVSLHAVSGAMSADALGGIDGVLAESPDAVVLLIGTNDLAWRKSVEHVVRNIESIMVTVRRTLPEALVVVVSVLPREARFAKAVREINRHVWQFASTVHAEYLDLWPELADESGTLGANFSDDGLHLNEAGYRAWLGALRPLLEEQLGEAGPDNAVHAAAHAASDSSELEAEIL